jgi:hypothetical protein
MQERYNRQHTPTKVTDKEVHTGQHINVNGSERLLQIAVKSKRAYLLQPLNPAHLDPKKPVPLPFFALQLNKLLHLSLNNQASINLNCSFANKEYCAKFVCE